MTWLAQTPSLTLPRWEREQNPASRGQGIEPYSEGTGNRTLHQWEMEQNPSPMRQRTEPSPIGGGQGGG
jgi:hypothetical protein